LSITSLQAVSKLSKCHRKAWILRRPGPLGVVAEEEEEEEEEEEKKKKKNKKKTKKEEEKYLH